MTLAMQNLTAFERGQADYQGGRRVCPYARQNRIEAWLDGWRTAAGQARRRTA
jgi:ribosome modulation factor